MTNGDSVDITFLCRGFVAEFGAPDERCLAAVDGRYILAPRKNDLPKVMRQSLEKLGYVNRWGKGGVFSGAPKYLQSKWHDQVKIDLHKRVMHAMKVMCEKERIDLNSKASVLAAKKMKEYEETVEAKAASTGG